MAKCTGASNPDDCAVPARMRGQLRRAALSHQAVARELLQASPRAAAIAAAGSAALLLAMSLVLGALPAPLYSVPALLVGWGHCRAAAAALIITVTAYASVLGEGAAGSVISTLVTVLVLIAIWWGSLTARREYDEERSSARRDGLTGCLTLRAFSEALGLKLKKAREQSRPVALAYLDLDHFKEVNDRYGHAVGDRLLRHFSSELSRRLLAEDVIGRLGGDEFAVLLAEVHGPCAVQRLEQIVHDILGQQEFHVTASIGALIIDPGATVSQSELIVMTDHLMYEAKRSGKATVRTNLIAAAGPSEAELAA